MKTSSRAVVQVLFAVVALMFAFACSSESSHKTPPPPTLVVVQVAPATAEVPIGTSQQFTATALYGDGTSDDVSSEAAWDSDRSGVATVNAQGKASAVAEGVANITATFQGKTGKAVLTVPGITVTAVQVTPADTSIPKGTTQQFTATATLSDGTTKDVSADVTWTSSQAGVATISTAGLASAVAVGTTTVSASLGAATGSTSLSVNGAALQQIEVTRTNPPALPVGATFQFYATGRYTDGSTADLTQIATWKSSAPSVATVSAEGLATGVSGGTTELSALMGALASNRVKLTVPTGITLSYITLAPASATLVVGQSRQFTATGHYSDSSAFDLTSTATWATVQATTNTAVSNFSVSRGLVTALTSTASLPSAKGRVRASQGAVSAYSDVTVKDGTIASIDVDCSPSLQLGCIPASIGYSIECSAIATFSDGTTGDITTSATWSSTKAAVAVAGGTPGRFTVVGVGSAGLVASQGGKSSPSTGDSGATVRGIVANTTGLQVLPQSVAIAAGAQMQYEVRAQFATQAAGCSGVWLDVTQLATWSTSDAAVATISNAAESRGLAEGHAVGTVQIQAKFTGLIETSTLEVRSACLASVTIEQVNPGYPGNVLVPLTVRGTYSDGATIRLSPGAGLNWGVAGGLAAIDGSWNLDTALLPVGSTTAITFAAGPDAGTCTGLTISNATSVRVSAASLTGLSLEPGSSQIPAGGRADFIAKATFAGFVDAYNVSAHTTWSNTPAITGLASGLRSDRLAQRFQASTATGTTTVVAVYGNQTATATLVISGSTIASVTITDISVGGEVGLSGQVFPVGLDLRFSATVSFSDGTRQLNPSGLSFSSDAPGKLAFSGSTNLARTSSSSDPDPRVTATYQGVTSAPLPVRIGSGSLSSLTFSPSPALMPKNSTMPLVVRGDWDGDVTYPFNLSRVVSCSSGNAAIVAVSTGASGTTLQSFSTATGATPVPVTCLYGVTTGSVNVTVNDSCIATIAVSPAALTLPKGATQGFVATATRTDGTPQDVTNAGTWTSSASGVLSYLGTAGLFKGLSSGSATVGFSLAGNGLQVCAGGDTSKTTVTGSASVLVSAAEIASVVIEPAPVSPASARRIPLGETIQLHARATLTDGSELEVTDDPSTAWSTQAPEYATVSATGALTATGVGETLVEVVTANGKAANLLVQVEDCGSPAVSISTAVAGSLPVGSTRDYAASATYAESASCTGDSTERQFTVTSLAQWVSSQQSVASIGSGGSHPGRATALGAGTTSISAVYRGATSNASSLSVVAVTLKALEVSPASVQTFVGAGSAVLLTPLATYTDGTTDYRLAPPPITWLVVDPTVVAIGTDNKLTGLKIGTTTFRAQSGAIVSDPVTATVSAACITGVQIVSLADGTVMPGGVVHTLRVQCTTSDGSALPCNPTFSAPGGGSVSDYTGDFEHNGAFRVTASATLTATVSACGGTLATDSVGIVLGSARLSSLVIGPTSLSIPRGESRIITAGGNYTNGTGSGFWDLTPVASYWSSNELVVHAENNQTGQVKAMADGTAVIRAEYLGLVSNLSSVTVSGKTLSSVTISANPGCTGTLVGANAAYPGGGMQLGLHADGTYSDGSSGPLTGTATWALVSPIVAGTSIDPATGVLVTGTPVSPAEQIQRVRASVGYVTSTFDVAIVNASIASIAITGPGSVADGQSVQFTASATLLGTATSCSTNTYAVTRNLNWASSDPTKGKIGAAGTTAGVFTAVSLGTTNVTAVRGTATGGPVVVTITSAVPDSVACQPASVAVGVGDRAQLRAVVTYSDASQSDANLSQAQWNESIVSGAESIAFGGSDLGGILTAQAVGTASVAPVVRRADGTALPVTGTCSISVN